jgi:hypothetical protein
MGLVKEESVGVVTQNCKQRATQTRATTETTATTETAAVMRAKTMRKNERSKNHGRDKKCRTIVVVKNLNCGFCVSKLESTTSTMLYSHLGRYYLRSIPLVQFDFSVKEILAFHRNVIRFL